MAFEEFIKTNEKKLKAGLISTYGPTLGSDCLAEALAYGWENWSRLKQMDNPVGYLYRVGQTHARRSMKPSGYMSVEPKDNYHFEPELIPALESLSESQRLAVVLVHGLGWPLSEAAEVLDVSVSTLRTHIQRALTKLRTSLKVDLNAS